MLSNYNLPTSSWCSNALSFLRLYTVKKIGLDYALKALYGRMLSLQKLKTEKIKNEELLVWAFVKIFQNFRGIFFNSACSTRKNVNCLEIAQTLTDLV
jgi:hypothetical protein